MFNIVFLVDDCLKNNIYVFLQLFLIFLSVVFILFVICLMQFCLGIVMYGLYGIYLQIFKQFLLFFFFINGIYLNLFFLQIVYIDDMFFQFLLIKIQKILVYIILRFFLFNRLYIVIIKISLRVFVENYIDSLYNVWCSLVVNIERYRYLG